MDNREKPVVLVVDDAEEIRSLLTDFYENQHGYRVLKASNAEKAIRIAEQNRGKPTVALVDIGLPGKLNGVQLINYFTLYAPHIACHVITGSSDISVHRQAKWAGAVEVLVKPLDEDDLKRAVQSPLVARLVTKHMVDKMTGLTLRHVFESVANGHILAARRRGEPLSLLFIDIDRFKGINDHFGHKAGDQALGLVGLAISEHVRPYDHPCRWGGDELAILLPYVNESDALVRVLDLKAVVSAKRLELEGGQTVNLSISVGVAALRPEDSNILDLVNRADEAMRADKDDKGR